MTREEFLHTFLQLTKKDLEKSLPEKTSEIIFTKCALIMITSKLTHILNEEVKIINGKI